MFSFVNCQLILLEEGLITALKVTLEIKLLGVSVCLVSFPARSCTIAKIGT